jgi:protein AbiQ
MQRFYTIDFDYLRYMKEADCKVPNFDYDEHDKFFFGVVLQINDMKYFAPISSKKVDNATSMPIKEVRNKRSEQIASIRLCFMLPVPDDALEEVDIAWLRLTKGENYADFVAKEYSYCKNNFNRITRRAQIVYNFGTHPEHKYYQYCCNFHALEDACRKWKDTE